MIDHAKRDALRSHAQQLAGLLATEEGACILGSLQQLRLLWNTIETGDAPSREGASSDAAEGAASLRIGIWTGERSGGAFRRIPYVEAWNRYADVELIPPKSHKKRVLLLGESSARAYLYDPVVTVAGLVEAYLHEHHDAVEVIDLAMIGQDMEGLEAILESSGALQPDVIVVFAGNNWIFEPVPPLDEPPLTQALAQGDLAEAKRLHVEEILVRRVHAFLRLMQEVLQRNNARGVFVVPEFNLVHHVDQTVDFVPALPPERTKEWMERRSRADGARRQGDLQECARYAREMAELDRGLHPAPHRMLAECAAEAGDTDAAYRHYCQARDVSSGLLAYCTPRCPTSIQDAIRAGCLARGIGIVDLREVFRREHGLPDRALFLDYCHLTLSGLRLASREIAAHLLKVVGGPSVTAASFTRDPVISPLDEATAHLLAAIHNGHVGASLEAVTYGCDTALRICPDADVLMLSFLDFRSRRSPDWMARSYELAMKSRSMQRCLVTQPLPAYLTLGDVPLYQAMEDVLEERGIDARGRFERLRLEEAQSEGDEIDLLRSRRISMTLVESRRYAYYRSRHRTSCFYLLAEAAPGVTARVTWRTRNEGASAVVRLNGALLMEGAIGPAWTTAAVDLPADALRSGTNCLEIEWSVGFEKESHRDRTLYNPLRPPPEAYHVFGEIQDLTVLTSRDVRRLRMAR